ncbi:hypothetical protein ACLOJK_017677 [Asimina triloba]
MHHIISAPSSLTSPSFPVLLKQPHLHSFQFRHPYRRRRITISSSSKPHTSIQNPPNVVPSPPLFRKTDKNPFDFFQKTLTAAVFCATIAFFPTYLIPMPATAAPAVAPARAADKTAQRSKSTDDTDHEHSEHTRRLLAVVAVLLQRIEDAKSGRAEMGHVKEALKEVALKREELQNEILSALNRELEEMDNEEDELTARGKKALLLFQVMEKQKDDLERRRGQGEEVKEKIDELEKNMDATEKEYNEISDKFEDIEDAILRKETMAFNIALRELSFIQKECETLVKVFERQWKKMKSER